LQIFCADQDEIDHYWDRLTADGGEESMCGWLKDKYGFSWQVVPSALYELDSDDPAKQKAVADAIFRMKKLDIAELQRAIDSA
jgi:predicted 3-demethylubiquinone-9 3-methyltransferase (glyoxalase superfamily)